MSPLSAVAEYIKSFVDASKFDFAKDASSANIYSFLEPESARFICFLLKRFNVKQMLEVGTCVGYSTMFFAEVLKHQKGFITSVENNSVFVEEAKANFLKANLKDVVGLIEGDIEEILKDLPNEKFDLIFVDHKKSEYIQILDDVFRVLKKGGIIVADDTLFKPLEQKKHLSKSMDEYNKKVFNDSRLYSSIVPLGDGLTLSLKL